MCNSVVGLLVSIFAHHIAARSVVGYCLLSLTVSVRLSVSKCIAAKRYILQQKRMNK